MAEINAKINYGNLNKLVEEMTKNYTVKVGLLAEKNGNEYREPLSMKKKLLSDKLHIFWICIVGISSYLTKRFLILCFAQKLL